MSSISLLSDLFETSMRISSGGMSGGAIRFRVSKPKVERSNRERYTLVHSKKKKKKKKTHVSHPDRKSRRREFISSGANSLFPNEGASVD